jgi:molecular chaperone DnaK
MAIVGIDLGTTTSEVAAYENDGPRIIRDIRGNEIVDSYFGLDPKTKNPIVGERAKNIRKAHEGLIIEEVKRRMGEDTLIKVGDQSLTPAEVSAHILRHLKQAAEEQLDESVDRCVITVPANFPDPARRATQQAGEIAGMKVERIINEPTAAALAYGHAEDIEDEHVMVYDLGGGTFDVSIVEYMGEVLDVLASAGDPHLGGKDFDKALADYVLDRFKSEHRIDIDRPSTRYYSVLDACEEAKKELSFNRRTSVNIPFFTVKDGTPINLDVEVTRRKFEDLVAPMIDRTESAINKALNDSGISRNDVDRIILVGGSTRIPYVQSLVERVMGQKPSRRIDPDKAVALGAAAQTAIIDGTSSQIIMDVCPLSLGTAAMDQIAGGVRAGRYSEIIETNGKQLQPYERSYRTVFEDQEAIDFRVYQRDCGSDAKQAEIEGEPNMDAGFILLTRREIDVPPGPAGQMLTATYVYNPDGMIDITIRFEETGEEHTFQASAGLDEEQIEASRQKLEAAWQESEYLGDVEALMEAAERELSDGSVPPKKEDRLLDLLDRMKRSLAANDEEAIRELEDYITDLLFELD